MGLLDRFKTSAVEQQTFAPNGTHSPTDNANDEKGPVDASNNELYDSDGHSISSAQDGIKKAQATTIVWTRNALIFSYGL